MVRLSSTPTISQSAPVTQLVFSSGSSGSNTRVGYLFRSSRNQASTSAVTSSRKSWPTRVNRLHLNLAEQRSAWFRIADSFRKRPEKRSMGLFIVAVLGLKFRGQG